MVINGERQIFTREQVADKDFHILQQVDQVDFGFNQIHPARLNRVEIQDFIDQAEQIVAGGFDLLQAVAGFLRVAAVPQGDVRHAENAVQRRPHIVAHFGKERRLRAVGSIRLHGFILHLAVARVLLNQRAHEEKHQQHKDDIHDDRAFDLLPGHSRRDLRGECLNDG